MLNILSLIKSIPKSPDLHSIETEQEDSTENTEQEQPTKLDNIKMTLNYLIEMDADI